MVRNNHIMLLITENCNLQCSYCYEHRKNAKMMEWNTARTILDNELSKIKPDEDTVIIEVFGGEAFLNFELLKRIDEYLIDKYPQLNFLYETTTNGTCVHGEIQEWLKQRKERFLMSLSLDGDAWMHNINRRFADGSGSFDKIDIDFFVNTWPNCPAKMTISSATLQFMARGVKYIEKLGFKCDATLSIGVEWNYEKLKSTMIEQLNLLVAYYSDNPNMDICTLLKLDLRQIFAAYDREYRFCGAGVDIICYDADGDKYPCQGFAPISIGDAAKEFENYNQSRFCFTEENICRHCKWVRLCSNCYAANYQSTGNIQIVDEKLCDFYKLCIIASARIQFNRLMTKDHYTNDDKLILKAIQIIQEELSDII